MPQPSSFGTDRRQRLISALIPRTELEKGKLIADIIQDRRQPRIATCVIQERDNPDILFLGQFHSPAQARIAAEQFFSGCSGEPAIEWRTTEYMADFALRLKLMIKSSRSAIQRSERLLRGTKALINLARKSVVEPVVTTQPVLDETSQQSDGPPAAPTVPIARRKRRGSEAMPSAVAA